MSRAGALLLVLVLLSPAIVGAQSTNSSRYDEHFRKYTKRYFGPGFDWQYFKAQAMAESNLEPTATSRVGAKGVMQLMPATYDMIKSRKSELGAIEDPESNIAAGIAHSRGLWLRWKDHEIREERLRFMFASYNAGEGTILRAKKVAQNEQLDARIWNNIELVAPKVQRWRYRETLPYVRKIEANHDRLVSQPRRTNAVKR